MSSTRQRVLFALIVTAFVLDGTAGFAAQPVPVQNISDNPAYFNTAGQKPSPKTEDLDHALRQVLDRVLGGVKLIFECGWKTQKDGEVILSGLGYVSRKYIDGQDVKDLHAAFLVDHFGPSPRLGEKPTITLKYAAMSFFKKTKQAQYSLVIKIDLTKQTIKVESYRLGSKYDRLM